MKLRPIFAVFPFLLVSQIAHAQGARAPLPLKITLAAEEPTGVFFDRDTLSPQTPLLFTARVENPAPETRQVELSWKITDASGRVRLERESKFSVGGGDSIVRRELFDAPARGGYLLETLASSQLKGPDIVASAALPFAVTVAPAPGANAARPQSFFVLSTPALLSGAQLDFYSRLGARVLRSPLPPDPARPDWAAIEAQLGERLKRNLATIALLPLSDERGSRSDTFFARSVPATLARYGSLTTWELAGDISPADLDAWSQVARSRRRDIALLGPFPRGLDDGLPAGASIKINALEGATFNWPRSLAHPTALRRLWLSRAATTRNAGLPAFHLRRDEENAATSPTTTSPSPALPSEAAAEMTSDYLSAIMAGASSMSETLSPPQNSLAGAGQMARGAAFSMLSRTLEDAAFREELFPRSPAFEGALFRAPRGSIAILYATRDIGKMLARVAPARCYDVFGNPISADQRGALEIPLSGQPVFVLSDVPTDVLSFALRNAQISGIRPLEAQFLPLSRVPGTGEGSLAVRVRLQNIGLGDQSGQIKLQAPKGWKLATNRYDFRLSEGESKTYEFRAVLAPFNPKWPVGRVPLEASFGGKIKDLEAEVPIASALSVSPNSAPKLDGNLGEWDDALWQIAPPNAAGVSAKLALKWDKNRLYLAAQVRETGLSPRRPDETNYDFWRDYDALQFAFGTSNGPETLPSAGPFRDSDRGFLLSPFGRSAANDYTGRVLKLWGPDKPYNSVADRVRWGGAVVGASCVVSRDEKAGVTNYEAQIPFSALPDIDPLELAARDGAVRFGWLLHNDEGATLDFARAAGSFPWWANTSTFLPEGRLSSPLRSTLGFTLGEPLEIAAPAAPQPAIAPPLEPIATPPNSAAPRPVLVPSVVAPTPIPTPIAPPKPVVKPTPAPTLPPGLPAPSGPLQPRPAPNEPQEIAPFIVPDSDENQPLPPAAPAR